MTVDFESIGSIPTSIRIGGALAKSESFQCQRTNGPNYNCRVSLDVIAITETFHMAVISDTLPIDLAINSVTASHGNVKCDLLDHPIYANKARLGTKRVVYSKLDLSLCP